MAPANWTMMTDKPDDEGDTKLITKPKEKTQRPPMYKVLLLNDDFTPMEFVVHVLERFFAISHAQSVEIMLTVHKKGVAVVGVFSYEIAETKVAQVMDFAVSSASKPIVCNFCGILQSLLEGWQHPLFSESVIGLYNGLDQEATNPSET